MKRIVAFIFIVLFAAVFLISCLPGVYDKSYGKKMNVVGQIGMGAGLIVFFILPGKKKVPPFSTRRDET